MYEQEIINILNKFGIKTEDVKLETPPQAEFGDIAFPCFDLAKVEKKNPQVVAEDIAKKIHISEYPFLIKVETRAGYVNFFFYWGKIAEKTLQNIVSKKKIDIGKGKRVMVEFSQPNPVHSMHIGHARGTFIGDSLSNIFDFLGYKAVRTNYMNDVGLQVAKLVTSYIHWANRKKPKGKPDMWLWQLYVKFHEEAKINPALEDEAREILRKFEIEKDKKITRVWKKIVKWCVKGFEETYRELGIKFNVYFYESHYRESGKDIVYDALRKNVATKTSEDTIITNLEKYGLPDTVLLRSNDTGLYMTSDLGLTVHKFEKYKVDKSLWIVSSQQALHFKQLFKIVEVLGYPWSEKCFHVQFEHVVLPEGKMSSREGRAVMLDEVVASLIKSAYNEVSKRGSKLSKKEKTKLAKKIGIGAIKYAILKIEPNASIVFDWKQMLRFDGNNAPYLQYAHTRCAGILRRAERWNHIFFPSKLEGPEKELVRKLFEFRSVVENSAKDFKPNYICNYIYGLATAFDKFYEFCPVLKADEKTKNFRLTLVEATKIVLGNALKLVGIDALEKM